MIMFGILNVKVWFMKTAVLHLLIGLTVRCIRCVTDGTTAQWGFRGRVPQGAHTAAHFSGLLDGFHGHQSKWSPVKSFSFQNRSSFLPLCLERQGGVVVKTVDSRARLRGLNPSSATNWLSDRGQVSYFLCASVSPNTP